METLDVDHFDNNILNGNPTITYGCNGFGGARTLAGWWPRFGA